MSKNSKEKTDGATSEQIDRKKQQVREIRTGESWEKLGRTMHRDHVWV